MDKVKLCCLACGQINRVAFDRLGSKPICGICGAALTDGRVHELDSAAHEKATRADDLPLLVDYWAPWCGPCRAMAPEFAKAAKALAPTVRFAKLNTEEYPAVASRKGIKGIPALILYLGGREIGRLSGARPSSDIQTFVRSHLPSQA